MSRTACTDDAASLFDQVATMQFRARRPAGLLEMDTANKLPDATAKYIAVDSLGSPLAFVQWSSAQAPDSAAEAAAKAAGARNALGERLGRFVTLPVGSGVASNRSFSIYPMLQAPGNRVTRRLVYSLASRVIFPWLCDVAAHTCCRIEGRKRDESVLAPLVFLSSFEPLPAHIREHALCGAAATERGIWKPTAVFSHNDLWTANVMFSSATKWPRVREPRIIDWGACAACGIPYFDAIRYARTAALPNGVLSFVLHRLAVRAGTSLQHGMYDLLAGVGRLGLSLGEFPRDRFAALVTDTVATYNNAIRH